MTEDNDIILGGWSAEEEVSVGGRAGGDEDRPKAGIPPCDRAGLALTAPTARRSMIAMTGTDVAIIGFNYAELDADIADKMREAAGRVRGLMLASVIEVGRELLAIKERVEHGQFREWIERECNLMIRTAERAMQAAALVEKNDKLSYLPVDGLLALGSRFAPKPAVAEIVQRIEAGERLTAAEIKRRIAEAKSAVADAKAEAAPAAEFSADGTTYAPGPFGAVVEAYKQLKPSQKRFFCCSAGLVPVSDHVKDRKGFLTNIVELERKIEQLQKLLGQENNASLTTDGEPTLAAKPEVAKPEAPSEVISEPAGARRVVSPLIKAREAMAALPTLAAEPVSEPVTEAEASEASIAAHGAGHRTSANPTPSSAKIPTVPPKSLRGHFLDIPATAQRATWDWTMRGYACKEDPPSVVPESFVQAWVSATEADQNQFRAEMLNWKPKVAA